MYKMIALDLDGTLLGNDHQISKENQLQIQRAREHGIIICIATGRGMKSASEMVSELELDGPFVTANGSEVWSTHDTLLFRTSLPHDMVARLLEIAERNDVWFWSYTANGLVTPENYDGNLENITWLKLGFFDKDGSKIGAAYEEIKEWDGLEISNSHLNNLEINPGGITKAVGLKMICDLHGITMEEVIACGDSLNDVEMIKAVGLGVAMGNAQPAVKHIADYVADTNLEDGVAKVIQKFVFGEG